MILSNIEFPCEKYFSCSNVLSSKVNFTTVNFTTVYYTIMEFKLSIYDVIFTYYGNSISHHIHWFNSP